MKLNGDKSHRFVYFFFDLTAFHHNYHDFMLFHFNQFEILKEEKNVKERDSTRFLHMRISNESKRK